MKDVIKEIFKSNDFIGIDESFLSEKDLQFNLARMLENFGFKNVILEYPIVNKVDTFITYPCMFKCLLCYKLGSRI